VPGVRVAVPFVEGQAFASGSIQGRRRARARHRGTGTSSACRRSRTISASAPCKSSTAAEGVAIGRRLADSLGVRIGDRVTLLGPDGPRTPFGIDAAAQELSGRPPSSRSA
jgi:lipoprotein-releasing system permease protein